MQKQEIEQRLGSRTVFAGALTTWLRQETQTKPGTLVPESTTPCSKLTTTPPKLRLHPLLLDGGQGKYCLTSTAAATQPNRPPAPATPPLSKSMPGATQGPNILTVTTDHRDRQHGTTSHPACNILPSAHNPAPHIAYPDSPSARSQGTPERVSSESASAMQTPEGGQHPVTPNDVRLGFSPPVQPRVWPGLQAPTLVTGAPVTGTNKANHRRENKKRRKHKQLVQAEGSYWTTYEGAWQMPHSISPPPTWRNCMCPSGLALHHPAAGHLLSYATGGCPANTGRNWTRQEMEAAICRGPHVSAREPRAMAQLATEIAEKVANNQARVVLWDDIRTSPPPNLKISPVAMIPHKSRGYRAILDLSFRLRLSSGKYVPSVNEATTLTAPRGAIDQMGHSLSRIVHAFAETSNDAAIFMAKFDIKDGFWRLDCAAGEEWNFAYVMPQAPGEPIKLVVPSSLQMGWVESPAYFCVASETARDVAAWHAERSLGEIPTHKLLAHAMGSDDIKILNTQSTDTSFRYFLDVYIDDFIQLAIPTSQQQLEHIANAVMTGIHEVFPSHQQPDEDPISHKKLGKGDGTWSLTKDLLGFTFDGTPGRQTMQLEAPKREFLLTILHKWLRAAKRSHMGIPLTEFESVTQKIRHAFMAIPCGRGLLNPCNTILSIRPPVVFLHHNKALHQAMKDCRTLLRETSVRPTPCRELVMDEPDFVGVKDASLHGVGGIIVGHKKACRPTVF